MPNEGDYLANIELDAIDIKHDILVVCVAKLDPYRIVTTARCAGQIPRVEDKEVLGGSRYLWKG